MGKGLRERKGEGIGSREEGKRSRRSDGGKRGIGRSEGVGGRNPDVWLHNVGHPTLCVYLLYLLLYLHTLHYLRESL